MQISENGLSLIRGFEGFRSSAYKDTAGNWTIGYGHKILPHEEYPAGVTPAQADALLLQDVREAEKYVTQLAPQANQNQFDALVDFCFNLGWTRLKTMLSHGWEQVPTQMMRWDLSNGVHQSGLTERRAAEVKLFNS
jgi:lysozyme